MTELDDNVTPRPVPDTDPTSLDVQPSREEFFVLSRVDGSTPLGQLCKVSGLGKDKTIDCIRNLHSYGLVELPGVESPSDSPDGASTGSTTDSSSADVDDKTADDSGDDTGDIPGRFPIAFDDYQFNAQLMEQSVEIDDDFKREVLYIHGQLDDVDHYQLLGVDTEAQRRQLRKAYFRMSKRFHPDRFYRKILGDFEPMIEAIFQRVTQAYQTLTNDRKRREYDASLKQGTASHQQSGQSSTPASRESATREGMKGNIKKEMAYKVLVQRSDDAMENGQFAQAVDGYRKALSLQRDADLALRVAQALLEADVHLDEATSFARAAHKIDESSPEPLELIGRIYERKQSPDDAIYHYEQAIDAGADSDRLSERISQLDD